MDEINSIYKDYMNRKTNLELLEIIKQVNHAKWSIDAIQTAKEILKERKIKIPPEILDRTKPKEVFIINDVEFNNEKLGRILERTYNTYKKGINVPFITAFETKFNKKVSNFEYLIGIISSNIFSSLNNITEIENFESDEIIYDYYFIPDLLIQSKSPYLFTNKRIFISNKNDFSEEYTIIKINEIKSFKENVGFTKIKLEFILVNDEIITLETNNFETEDYVNSLIQKSEFVTSLINTPIDNTKVNLTIENSGVSPKNQPFDEDSLKLVNELPKRLPFISGILSLLKLLSVLILGFGGIGLAMLLFQEYDETTKLSAYILMYALVAGVFAVGGAIYYIAKLFIFEKAPLGNLVQVLLEGINRQKIDEVSKIAATIISKTADIKKLNTSYLFAKMFALQTLSEINADKKLASEAIILCKKLIDEGTKTPLVYFCLGTAGKIANEKETAIAAYTEYLKLHPQDIETKEELWKLNNEKT